MKKCTNQRTHWMGGILLGLAVLFALSGEAKAEFFSFEPKKKAAEVVEEVKTPKAMSAKVNINEADLKGIQQIKGVGPKLAERILTYRESYGAFESIEDISKVRGIGGSKLQKIKSQIVI